MSGNRAVVVDIIVIQIVSVGVEVVVHGEATDERAVRVRVMIAEIAVEVVHVIVIPLEIDLMIAIGLQERKDVSFHHDVVEVILVLVDLHPMINGSVREL